MHWNGPRVIIESFYIECKDSIFIFFRLKENVNVEKKKELMNNIPLTSILYIEYKIGLQKPNLHQACAQAHAFFGSECICHSVVPENIKKQKQAEQKIM